MRRAIVVALSFTLALLHIHLAEAQQSKKVARIGYLTSLDAATESNRAEAIRLALRKLGYMEGQNIAFEYRYTEGKGDRAPDLAAELVRLKVDVIVIAGERVVRAAMNATQTIPIVLAGAGLDPVTAGHVGSLARPGGNITGITNLNRELSGKRLELLKEAVPKLARVAVLYNPNIPTSVLWVKEALPVEARTLKLTVQPWEARNTDDFGKVFAAIGKQRPDALDVLAVGSLMRANQKRIIGFALKSRLPSMFSESECVDAGGLMYYGADETDSYRRVAYFVDKILKGAKPADLPVEQPTKLELVINLKTAKQIGLVIPPSVLARANKVIK